MTKQCPDVHAWKLDKKYRSGSGWQRLRLAVETLATQGISVRQEAIDWMADDLGISPGGGALKNFWRELPETGLVHVEAMPLIGPSKITLIRLTNFGRDLAWTLGINVVESEWDTLRRLHDGDAQTRHTACVLMAAYQARRSWYSVDVLPKTPIGEPDLKIYGDAAPSLFVEVELGHGKAEKWRHQYKLQGRAALIALTAARRAGLMRECQELGLAGCATDIETLCQGGLAFWAEVWG